MKQLITQTVIDTSWTRRALTISNVDEHDPQLWMQDDYPPRQLLIEESTLDTVPEWAQQIVTRMLGSPLAPCGHYTFPAPIEQILEAMGNEHCPDIVIGCYTADPERKRRMQIIIYCLDAWLHEAPLDTVLWDLKHRDIAGVDWPRLARSIYAVLGDVISPRDLLIQRLIHRLRWWVKSHSWLGDLRTEFGIDQYLGDLRGDGEWGDFGDPDLRDPYFVELREPIVVELEQAIRQEVKDADAIIERIHSTWLCAPKAFRYLERILIEIGSIGTEITPDYSQSILASKDTWIDFTQAQHWHNSIAGNSAPGLAEALLVCLNLVL